MASLFEQLGEDACGLTWAAVRAGCNFRAVGLWLCFTSWVRAGGRKVMRAAPLAGREFAVLWFLRFHGCTQQTGMSCRCCGLEGNRPPTLAPGSSPATKPVHQVPGVRCRGTHISSQREYCTLTSNASLLSERSPQASRFYLRASLPLSTSPLYSPLLSENMPHTCPRPGVLAYLALHLCLFEIPSLFQGL